MLRLQKINGRKAGFSSGYTNKPVDTLDPLTLTGISDWWDPSDRTKVLNAALTPCADGGNVRKITNKIGNNPVNAAEDGHIYNYARNSITASEQYYFRWLLLNTVRSNIRSYALVIMNGRGWLFGETYGDNTWCRGETLYGGSSNDYILASAFCSTDLIGTGTFPNTQGKMFKNGTQINPFTTALGSSSCVIIGTTAANVPVKSLSQGNNLSRCGMEFGDIMLSSAVWSGSEITSLNNYLMKKWNIA